MSSIVVLNLRRDQRESELRALLEPFGWVEDIRFIDDKRDEKSVVAFADFTFSTDLQAAVAALDGAFYRGRRLTVQAAKERTREQ